MDALSPDLSFRAGNLLALSGWIALALSPPSRRWTPRVWQLTGWVLPLLLGSAYVALLVAHWGPGGFGSLAEVRQLFELDDFEQTEAVQRLRDLGIGSEEPKV